MLTPGRERDGLNARRLAWWLAIMSLLAAFWILVVLVVLAVVHAVFG